jgi:putative hydrolase of the HAD superfamily
MKKALIFDLDDTLYDCNYTNNTASVEAVCCYTANTLLRREECQVREAFDRARLSLKEQMLGDVAAQHNRMLYFQKTLELLGYAPVSYALEMYDYFWNDFLKRIRLYDGAKELLCRWKEDGGKIGICTDMTVHIQHRKLRSLGIDGLIDVLVTSEEVGVEKPDPAIYRKVLEKLGVCPQEAVYIGDSLPKDVLGPMKMGMDAIWYLDEHSGVTPSQELLQLARENGVEKVENYASLQERLFPIK